MAAWRCAARVAACLACPYSCSSMLRHMCLRKHELCGVMCPAATGLRQPTLSALSRRAEEFLIRVLWVLGRSVRVDFFAREAGLRTSVGSFVMASCTEGLGCCLVLERLIDQGRVGQGRASRNSLNSLQQGLESSSTGRKRPTWGAESL